VASMSGNHFDLYEYIRESITAKRPFVFHKIKAESHPGYITGFEVPPNEVFDISNNNQLQFLKGNVNNYINVKMGGLETRMAYISEYDIYVGYRKLGSEERANQITYQIVLKLIYLGHLPLLQITYHNMDETIDLDSSHDGTIHPIP